MQTARSRFLALASGLALALLVGGCGGSVESSGSGGAGGSGGSSGGTGGASGGTGGASGCSYGGKQYPPGESFPAGDGCNTCWCEPGGGVACTLMDCPSGCIHNGKAYQPGESFPAGDGCNTCTCSADGMVACSGAYCPVECVYAGKKYVPGDSFPSLDGCNKCSCTAQGVSCTDMACACDPQKEWWRSYVAPDPQKCMVIDYGCPPNTKAFSNACGCGCEQDASCPQFFDCMPPSPCNLEEIKQKCPYSGVAF